MNTDKVVSAPGIGHCHSGLQAGGGAGAQLLFRVSAGGAGLKIGVGVQHIGQQNANLVINVLFAQAKSLCAGVGILRIVSQ